MKIERLNSSSLKISLNRSDMSGCGIEYDSWNSDVTAEFLLSVADEIKARTGTDITREKLYVEIFSKETGCLIFVSFPYRERTDKGKKCRIACTFADYDSLKEFCGMLKEEFPDISGKSSLYYSSSLLRLELEIPVSSRELIADMTEGGCITECDELSDAAVGEYYICAGKDSAVERILSS